MLTDFDRITISLLFSYCYYCYTIKLAQNYVNISTTIVCTL